jgi:hypothetical protein
VEGGADKEIKDEVRKLELISDGAFQRHDDSTLSRAASTITQRPIVYLTDLSDITWKNSSCVLCRFDSFV